MANFLVTIGKDVTVGAEDLFNWITGANKKIQTAGPQVISALGVLAGAITKAISDVEEAATNPASLVLSLGTDINDMKAVWPDVLKFFETLGIKA